MLLTSVQIVDSRHGIIKDAIGAYNSIRYQLCELGWWKSSSSGSLSSRYLVYEQANNLL